MARTSRRGVTLVELLVSVLILGASLLAMMSLWAFNYNLTNDHGTQNVALNLARRTVEEAKLGGFYSLPEGTLTLYADALGNVQGATQSSDSQFRLVLSVSTDRYSYNQEGNIIGTAGSALRTLTVSVFDLKEVSGSSPRLAAQTGTFLARSGV